MTFNLLSQKFKQIDLNDIVNFGRQWSGLKNRLQQMKQRGQRKGTIGEVYKCCMSRVDFANKYNLIYMNWGLNYLNDAEALTLLNRAKCSLATWN